MAQQAFMEGANYFDVTQLPSPPGTDVARNCVVSRRDISDVHEAQQTRFASIQPLAVAAGAVESAPAVRVSTSVIS
jgi:hypothetical protein